MVGASTMVARKFPACVTDAHQAPGIEITEAARFLGKLGGRPKGSCSSPLAQWLRAEARQRRAEGYRCREAFDILRDTEGEDGRDALTILDWTADEHYLEPGARVTWSYFRKIWADLGNRNRFP